MITRSTFRRIRRNRKFRPLPYILGALLAAGLGIWAFQALLADGAEKQPSGFVELPSGSALASPNSVPSPSSSPSPSATPVPPALPASKKLTVPWFAQAPTGLWDPLHEEACEEASLVMVDHYRKGTSISVPEGDAELKAMVAYEESRGLGVSITLAQLNEVAKAHSGMGTGRISVATIDALKREIAAGRPVIVPAAGRQLGNPNFTAPGPVYHMLVVTGYENGNFITNDPGTRKGQGYLYSEKTLFDAIHDYDETDIENGAKRYLVFD